ncbi:hypothetical protein [Candidatus Uabimicrobium sp. HlEnr_7]|uniref:hypothetical protein n=1 Tax=Candidatus Uabimicrobium helgolandensis TaxID=3095367 RepID=UPI0035568834
MILFHGTTEDNIKNIKRNGLLASTQDQWIMEVTKENVCCLSNEPTSGEGGSPIYFAGRHSRSNNQNGYLVVISLPVETFIEKRIAIFDNKIIDDYAQYHFFLREEFRQKGFELYKTLTKINAKNLDSIPIQKIEQRLIVPSQDQRTYYKKLPYSERELSYKIENIILSEHLYQFIKFIGGWNCFYDFLHFHFSTFSDDTYKKIKQRSPRHNADFWQQFYQRYSQGHPHFQEWFSPLWLKNKMQESACKNSQILTSSIEKKYIVGFIHVTNAAGVVSRFRPVKKHHKRQARYTLGKRIWREVYRMIRKIE